MNIDELLKTQKEFDSKHGWSSDAKNNAELINIASSDIVGLIGEIGEFSNLVKKAALIKNDQESLDSFILSHKAEMNEELIDSFIYMLRLFNLFKVDIGKEYQKKYNFNDRKFKSFEK
ncbi:nucleoside triphosphate pyrophosphohydrolase family protein [Neptuniibacter marinus]|uniref:hypothetical protein n=1 Tax=Neptuniibacter marinus TaxID=1806670 RepID=UPI0012E811B5|nr:hypothetical protein [Neptuniibacter marinus]